MIPVSVTVGTVIVPVLVTVESVSLGATRNNGGPRIPLLDAGIQKCGGYL